MERLRFANRGKHLDEEMARELLERVRWPDGPICPHCVVTGETLPGEPEEGFEKPSEAGGVEMQGLQEAIHGDGWNRFSR